MVERVRYELGDDGVALVAMDDGKVNAMSRAMIEDVAAAFDRAEGDGAAVLLTGRPGVCLTTSGPGFLNGLPALANATTNCFPMIQISGSSNRALVDLQRGDYQDLDQLNAARPFVKAAYRISRIEDIGLGVARAIRTAITGRPGGVYLDIPGEVLGQAMDAAAATSTVWRVVDPAPRQLAAPEAVERALQVLAQAQRPLIVLGKGAAYAQADGVIRKFVEATGIPFLPMSMAKGLLPDSHPQSAAAARSLARRAWLTANLMPGGNSSPDYFRAPAGP